MTNNQITDTAYYHINYNNEKLQFTFFKQGNEYFVLASRHHDTQGLVLIRTYSRQEAVNVYHDPIDRLEELEEIAATIPGLSA